jgi:hypothetical protein
MARTIAQLSEQEIVWIDGFTRGDARKFRAIVLGHFEGRGVREVESETGVPRSCVQRLIAEFKAAYDDWIKRRVSMGEVVNDGEEVRVLTHAAGTG